MKKLVALVVLAVSTFVYAGNSGWYIGVGYNGVSIKKDITPSFAVQFSYAGLGDVGGARLRGIYKFQQYHNYSLYGFGGIAYASKDVESTMTAFGSTTKEKVSATTTGAEFGAGIELDLSNMLGNIPIFLSIEGGYRASSTDIEGEGTVTSKYGNTKVTGGGSIDYSGAIAGAWIHYEF